MLWSADSWPQVLAKDLVRTRNYVTKFIEFRSHLQGVGLKLETVRSHEAMAGAMKDVTKAMVSLNKQVSPESDIFFRMQTYNRGSEKCKWHTSHSYICTLIFRSMRNSTTATVVRTTTVVVPDVYISCVLAAVQLTYGYSYSTVLRTLYLVCVLIVVRCNTSGLRKKNTPTTHHNVPAVTRIVYMF